jgi:DNA-binding transcriptional MocR family regulator
MKSKFMLIPDEMLGDSRLRPLDMVVYAALDSFVDSDGEAWPSIPTIARRCNVSPATVKRALSRLENAGYIVRRRRCKSGTKEFDSTLYTLSFRCAGAGSARTENGSGVSEVGSLKGGESALSVQEVSSERAGNYTHRTKNNELYPGTEHAANVEKFFNELWECYPRKSAKGEAKKAFMTLFNAEFSPEQTKQRLRAISDQFAIFEQEAELLIARGEERYIPYLHNWLTREGFADV